MKKIHKVVIVLYGVDQDETGTILGEFKVDQELVIYEPNISRIPTMISAIEDRLRKGGD